MDKERQINLVEYVAEGIRYATKESGLRDWTDAIIVLPNTTEYVKQKMLNQPVYVMQQMAYTFDILFPCDIPTEQEKAMRAIKEYQEINVLEG